MEYEMVAMEKAFMFVSLIFGFCGTVLFAKGVLLQNNKLIQSLALTRIQYNPYMVSSLIEQRFDFYVGLIFILFSFFVQLIGSFFDLSLGQLPISSWAFNCILIVIAVIILTIVLRREKKYVSNNVFAISSELQKHELEYLIYTQKVLSAKDCEKIINWSKEFWYVQKESKESNDIFIRKLLSELGMSVPKSLVVGEVSDND